MRGQELREKGNKSEGSHSTSFPLKKPTDFFLNLFVLLIILCWVFIAGYLSSCSEQGLLLLQSTGSGACGHQ